MEEKKAKTKLIIFDMDGVLIDVKGSYREATRKSVHIYLKEVLGVFNKNGVLSLADVDSVKKRGGLNNDWDLTYNILNSLLIRYFDEENKDLAFIAEGTRGKHEEEILKLISRYINSFKTSGIEKAIKKLRIPDIFDPRDWNEKRSPFLFYKGDVSTGNIVKRIFQELYLGRELFIEVYKENPIFYDKDGLINNEALIPKIDDIVRLSKKALLAIATGRPYVEAKYALERFSIGRFFNPLITEDDIVRAETSENSSLRKPHPFIVKECIKRIGYDKHDKEEIFYIGDMPDDIEAAKRASVIPIGFVYKKNKTQREIKEHANLLIKKGAAVVFYDFSEILNYFVP